jgi:hypothetical protein
MRCVALPGQPSPPSWEGCRRFGHFVALAGFASLREKRPISEFVWLQSEIPRVAYRQPQGEIPLCRLTGRNDPPAGGRAIVTSTTQCPRNIVVNDQYVGTTPCSPALDTLYTVDQNGNVTWQTPDRRQYQASGDWLFVGTDLV